LCAFPYCVTRSLLWQQGGAEVSCSNRKLFRRNGQWNGSHHEKARRIRICRSRFFAFVLAQGRAALQRRDYAGAADRLRAGIASAATITDGAQKQQALAALNFYAAVATYHNNQELKAREHLKNFFKYQPNATGVDAKRYDAGFVTIFNQVRTSRPRAGAVSFDILYPTQAPIGVTSEAVMGWRNSADFAVLASGAEKQQWDAISDEAQRETFVTEFWKRRDPTPDDERNEFRDEFQARVAFADYYFGSYGERGSLTDRGKVYLLLGKPGSVESRGFEPRDGKLSLTETAEYGNASLEIWWYPRATLPVPIPTVGVTYLFVTHERFGDHQLYDLEGMSLRALLAAGELSLKKKR
jgi:GWxTD domain-containing protein